MSRTQEEIRQPNAKVYAGIDVGKANLDFHIFPLNIKFRVTNDKRGIQKLARYCKKQSYSRKLVTAQMGGISWRC